MAGSGGFYTGRRKAVHGRGGSAGVWRGGRARAVLGAALGLGRDGRGKAWRWVCVGCVSWDEEEWTQWGKMEEVRFVWIGRCCQTAGRRADAIRRDARCISRHLLPLHLSPSVFCTMSGDDDSSGWQLTESDPGVFTYAPPRLAPK